MVAPSSVWRRHGKDFALGHLRTVAAFGNGLLVGALLAATTAYLLRSLLPWRLSGNSRIVVLLLACVLLAGVEIAGRSTSLPSARRQVPQTDLRNGSTRGMFRFGFEMGTGARTYLVSVTPYVLIVTVFLLHPNLAVYLAAAVGFSVGRLTPLVARFGSNRGTTLDRLLESSRSLARGSLLAAIVAATIAVQI